MIRTHRRGPIAAAAAVALLTLLSGCSGFVSSSMAQEHENPAAGAVASAGTMLIRNAFVLGPAPDHTIPRGGNTAAYVTLINNGRRPDRLVGASAGDAARHVQLPGGSVTVKPNQVVNVTLEGKPMLLQGLTKTLSGGESITLTLHFQRAGQVSVAVPVLPRSGGYATLSPLPTASPTAAKGTSTPGGSASATAAPTSNQ